jgi:AcrR family transcriptional regulator
MSTASKTTTADGKRPAAGSLRADGRPRRRDAREHRATLLTAVAALLAEQGPDFSLSAVAQRAGVSQATAYRHFRDVPEAIDAYYATLLAGMADGFDALPPAPDPIARMRALCCEWVRQAADWGPAAVYLRSPQGYLARLEAGDPHITAVHRQLSSATRAAIDVGALPDQDLDYAVLIWVTIFDERVVSDLIHVRKLTTEHAADRMTATLLAALAGGGAPSPAG